MKLDQFVVVGRIGTAFGLNGWTHVHSYTEPPTNLMTYEPLFVGAEANSWEQLDLVEFQLHGDRLIARIGECASREDAIALRNKDLAIRRSDLPIPKLDEFYWVDLVGLEVVNTDEINLGTVRRVTDYGASPVLEVDGSGSTYLIPLVKPIVDAIDLRQGLRVCWDATWKA